MRCTSSTALYAEKAINRNGVTMNNARAVVRFRTFGVRLNELFSPVISCSTEANVPDRFTSSRIRLKP